MELSTLGGTERLPRSCGQELASVPLAVCTRPRFPSWGSAGMFIFFRFCFACLFCHLVKQYSFSKLLDQNDLQTPSVYFFSFANKTQWQFRACEELLGELVPPVLSPGTVTAICVHQKRCILGLYTTPTLIIGKGLARLYFFSYIIHEERIPLHPS